MSSNPSGEPTTEPEISDERKDEIAKAKPAGAHQVDTGSNKSKPAPTEAKPQKPEDPNAAKENDFVEGSGSRFIELASETRGDLADVIDGRLKDILARKSSQPLSDIERAIKTNGEAVLKKLKGSETLTRDEIALGWFAVYDELILTQGAGGKLASEATVVDKVGYLRKVPVLNRFAPTEKSIAYGVVPGDHKLNSELAKDRLLDNENQDVLDDRVTELNDLRITIEESFFVGGIDNPMWDKRSTSASPLDIEGTKGHAMRNKITIETRNIMARKYEGKALADLMKENPTAALEVMHEATQIGYTEFASNAAKDILNNGDVVARAKEQGDKIDKHATDLEADKKATELPTLKKAQEDADEAYRLIKKEHDDFMAPFKGAEGRLSDAELTLKTAEQDVIDFNDDNKDIISNALNELNQARTKERDEKSDRLLPGPIKNGVQTHSVNPVYEQLEKKKKFYEEKYDALIKDQQRLIGERRKAERVRDAAKEEKAKIENEGNFKTKKDELIAELEKKKTALETATKALKDKQDETSDPEKVKENKEKATALRNWKKTGEMHGAVMETRFRQNERSSEYKLEDLANVGLDSKVEIIGAEKIRAHLFGVALGTEFSADLARKMLSDGELAKAIIQVYRLDINVVQDGKSLLGIFDEIAKNKVKLEKATNKDALRKKISTLEGQALQRVLPNLDTSEFLAGDLLTFITEQGLNSAARGEPFLTIEDKFLSPKPVVERQTENLSSPDAGRTEIDVANKKFTWEGSAEMFTSEMGIGGTKPLELRITQAATREPNGGPKKNGILIQAKINDEFFQTLPATFPGVAGDSLRGFFDSSGNATGSLRSLLDRGGNIRDFYDADGNKSTEKYERDMLLRKQKANGAEWITIGAKTDNDPMNALNQLDADSPGLADRIASSIVDSVLRLPVADRKTLLTGISDRIVTTTGYEITHSNGNFYIGDPATGRVEEFSTFTKNKVDMKIRANSYQPLSEADRRALSNEIKDLQSELGREILRAQQVR